MMRLPESEASMVWGVGAGRQAYLTPHIICQLGILAKLLFKVSIARVLGFKLLHDTGLLCLPQSLMPLPTLHIPLHQTVG